MFPYGSQMFLNISLSFLHEIIFKCTKNELKYVFHVRKGMRRWNGAGVVNGERSVYIILLLFICSSFFGISALCRLM